MLRGFFLLFLLIVGAHHVAAKQEAPGTLKAPIDTVKIRRAKIILGVDVGASSAGILTALSLRVAKPVSNNIALSAHLIVPFNKLKVQSPILADEQIRQYYLLLGAGKQFALSGKVLTESVIGVGGGYIAWQQPKSGGTFYRYFYPEKPFIITFFEQQFNFDESAFGAKVGVRLPLQKIYPELPTGALKFIYVGFFFNPTR
jgi:hypothetical protein